MWDTSMFLLCGFLAFWGPPRALVPRVMAQDEGKAKASWCVTEKDLSFNPSVTETFITHRRLFFFRRAASEKPPGSGDLLNSQLLMAAGKSRPGQKDASSSRVGLTRLGPTG